MKAERSTLQKRSKQWCTRPSALPVIPAITEVMVSRFSQAMKHETGVCDAIVNKYVKAFKSSLVFYSGFMHLYMCGHSYGQFTLY